MSDRYEIQEKIGQGGIGVVYQAYDTQLKRAVAIKRMLRKDEEVNGQDSAEMMLKEATTLSALQHPNIITVYDVGVDKDGPFVVMELLKGETLDQVIKRGVLTLRDFCQVVSQTMEALIAAEAAGVLHRDLKPTNVMVNWLPSKKFQVKILDFSLAKFSRKPSPQTIDQGDAIFGSIYFMAPEQFERGNLDQRTDLYSMGCLYYFCLAGQYPFQGESAAQVMASHLQGTVVSLEQIRSDLPPVICQWVMWLINRDAANRPDSAKEAFENYHQIAAAFEPNTGPVNLSGVPPVGDLSKTSRRLIVPPPRKTTAVTSVPSVAAGAASGHEAPSLGTPAPRGDGVNKKAATATAGARVAAAEAGAGAGARTTTVVTVMPRQGGGLITYLGIALGLFFLAAVGLGVRLWLQHSESEQDVQRFEALAGMQPPIGSAAEVALCVSYLDGFDGSTIAANKTLARMQDAPGARGTVDAAILAELKRARDTRVQENLIDIVHDRGLRQAEDLLLGMASTKYDPKVIRKAMWALGDLGEMRAFERLLGAISSGSSPNIHLGIGDAVESIGRRLPRRDVAVQKIEMILEGKSASVRHRLLQVVGALGGDEALRVVGAFLTERGELDEAQLKENRRVALDALMRWPERSQAVVDLVASLFDGPDHRRALEIYLRLALSDGVAPEQNTMIELLWTELRIESDHGEWNNVRGALTKTLPALDDRAFAKEIAQQMATSQALNPIIREAAAEALAGLEGERRDTAEKSH